MDNDDEGRVIAVDFGGFTMVNIYSPNSGRPIELKTMPKRRAFEKKLREMLLRLQKKQPVLAIGDLNIADRPQDVHEQWNAETWATHPSTTTEEKQMFRNLCFKTCLTDVQDAANVEGFTYWRNDREKVAGQGTRIDYALCPQSYG